MFRLGKYCEVVHTNDIVWNVPDGIQNVWEMQMWLNVSPLKVYYLVYHYGCV